MLRQLYKMGKFVGFVKRKKKKKKSDPTCFLMFLTLLLPTSSTSLPEGKNPPQLPVWGFLL